MKGERSSEIQALTAICHRRSTLNSRLGGTSGGCLQTAANYPLQPEVSKLKGRLQLYDPKDMLVL